MAEDCAVQVGIRIRPFNEREKKLGAELCVDVDGPTTILQVPPEANETDLDGKARISEPKKFTFDASFWSHDGFEETSTGYMVAAPGSRYADQQMVFDTFGRRVLDNAWEGYHCCLFAYGQTGSGKSYSMVGYGANKGIVPMCCEEIFVRVGRNEDPGLRYEVMVSMVEIYNEAVQDLLVKPNARPKKGLDIRESQQLGIYIAGVIKRPVDSYKAIERVVDEGTENRSVGATLMNATSSRAHTVLTIEFKQVSEAAGATGMKVSLINLVDLAGSEKAGQTGASGDRLKEGCAINKSLSALGNVIEKLADRATGKGKKGDVIPYRDSKLTRLLQNALGGSSKTVMICAISPASSNYDETLSTLRYADRAKRIKNAAVVNENPQDKLIRQLREENMKLKDMVNGAGPMSGGDGVDPEEMLLKQAEISALEEALREMQISFSERLKQAKKDSAKAQKERDRDKADLSLPHIANLNEDELLTNKLQFAFKEERTRIGRAGGGDDPEVVLAGVGIQKEHAVVTKKGTTCTLKACERAQLQTFVNGQCPPQEGVALKHGDRLVFGQCIFLFVNPAEGSVRQLLASGEASYGMARKELAEKQGELSGPSEEELVENRKRAEELEKRAREAEDARAAAESEAQSLLKQREEEYQRHIKNLQKDWETKLKDKEEVKDRGEVAAAEQAEKHAAELARLQRDFQERQRIAEEAAQKRIEELERRAQKAAAEEEDHRQHELNMRRLEEQLMFVMPLVKEANLIAVELQRPHRLETRMQVELSGERSRGTIRVTAAVMQDGARLYEWSPETLENRVFLLRELLQRCEDEGIQAAQNLQNEDDPLWDPVEVERLIGVAQILLEGLLLQVENQLDARILSTDGHQSGTLKVELWPVARDGTLGIPDEEVVDTVEDLLGTRMSILLKVASAAQLPEALANDVRIEFDYFIDEKPYKIPLAAGHNRNPTFNFETMFVQDPVTSRFLEYLKTKTLVFRVYGRDVQAEKVQAAIVEKKTVRDLNGLTMNSGSQSYSGSPFEASIGGNSMLEETQKSIQLLNETQRSIITVPGGVDSMTTQAVPGEFNASESIEFLSSPQKNGSPAPPELSSPEPPTFAPPTNEFADTTKAQAPSLSQIRRDQDKAAELQREKEASIPKKKTTRTCMIQ